jgi:hypothetical protein
VVEVHLEEEAHLAAVELLEEEVRLVEVVVEEVEEVLQKKLLQEKM